MSELLTQLIHCNQWRFIGRLGADPEIRFLDSGTVVCNARLLINKPGQKRDDGQKPYSFKLELWNDRAQTFADEACKGALIDVDGRIKTETWKDKSTGEQRQALVLQVESFEVVSKPGQQQQQQAAPAQQKPAPKTQPDWLSSNEVPF